MPRPVCLPGKGDKDSVGQSLGEQSLGELSVPGSSAGAALPAPDAVIRGVTALRRGAGPAGGCGG